MRRARTAVEQTGFAEDEGAVAQAGDQRAAVHRRAKFGQQWLDGGVVVGTAHVAAVDRRFGATGRDDDQIGGVESIEIVGYVDGVAHACADRLGDGRYQGEVVGGQTLVRAVEPEHLARDAEFELLGQRHQCDDHSFQHAHEYGRNSRTRDVTATRGRSAQVGR